MRDAFDHLSSARRMPSTMSGLRPSNGPQRDVFDDFELSHWILGVLAFYSGMARNSSTSTEVRQATTALRPHATASSMLAASSIQKPPMCSFAKVWSIGDDHLSAGLL